MTETLEVQPNSYFLETSERVQALGEKLSQLGFEGLTQEQRLEIIENATVDDYKKSADLLHQEVAPGEDHAEHSGTVKIINPDTNEVSHYTATPEERDGILQKALDNAKLVASKFREEGGSLEDALWRCSNLAAFGLVLAHRYKDANGRTARTMAELIYNGFDGSNSDLLKDLETLSTNRTSEGFRINSYVPTGDWRDRANEQPFDFLDAVAAIDIPLDHNSYIDATVDKFTTPRLRQRT